LKADKGGKEKEGRFYCPDCDTTMPTQQELDSHKANPSHEKMEWYQGQEAGTFQRMTVTEVTAPKVAKTKTANLLVTRRSVEAKVAGRGDGWKKNHKCQPCKYGTDRRHDFTKHEKSLDHLIMTDPDYIPGRRDPSSMDYYCDKCNYGTNNQGNFNRHLRINIGGVATTCRLRRCHDYCAPSRDSASWRLLTGGREREGAVPVAQGS
jgi:hypothetical protein